MKQKKFDIIFLCCVIGVIGLVLGVLAILDSTLQLGVNWYGLLIGIAFFIALLIVRELAKIKGFEKDTVEISYTAPTAAVTNFGQGNGGVIEHIYCFLKLEAV